MAKDSISKPFKSLGETYIAMSYSIGNKSQFCYASVLVETFYYGQGQAFQASQEYQVTHISM